MRRIEDFKDAAAVLEKVLLKTNLIYSEYFSSCTKNAVYLKPENMQKTGSFKIRGAYYKISKLTEAQKAKGIVTSSAGNHAQGVAYAAKAAGARAVIVMPTATPLVKVNNTKKYGAEVVLHGDYYDEASQHAAILAEEKGYTYVHPFNDLDVATGQGTVAYEILNELPETHAILVPVGGGGLAAGVAALTKQLKPNVKVYGVEPSGAACVAASLERKKVVSVDKVETVADGVAVRTPGDVIFPYLEKYLDGVITIDDDELIDAFLDIMENHKMVVENAGLLTVAALKYLELQGKNVVSVLSGGNMDVITMSSLVQHGLINRGRIFTFSVLLPDRPGELVNVASVIAAERGNVIRLEHNQFVNINRNSEVELRVTMEAFGHEHKNAIMEALRKVGYNPVVLSTLSVY